MKTKYQAVLFDLDGTLADTAPDLVRAFYRYCDVKQLKQPSYADLQAQVSNGVVGMLSTLFPDQSREQLEPARQQIVDYYAADLASETRLFDGVIELLDALEQRSVLWAIVTNKPDFLTQPLLKQLGLSPRAACIVAGDTTAHSKPHPEPLLHAARELNISAQTCLYLGDAERDVQASRAANMDVLIAGYGYINGHDVAAWQADGIIKSPQELLTWM